MTWKIKEKLRDVLRGEDGVIVKDPGGKVSVALVSPSVYEVGMANLAVHAIYDLLGSREDIVCERAFLPSPADLQEHLRSRTPVLTLESQRPLADFDVIAFSISFENDCLGIIPILEASGLAHTAGQRRERDPLIIAGGAAPTLNPLPLVRICDAVMTGEIEAFDDLVDLIATRAPRGEMLRALARLGGVVTAESAAETALPARRHLAELDASRTQTVIHYTKGQFADMHLIEVERGCPRSCRFCATPAIYGSPRRRSADAVIGMAREGLAHRKRMGLIGADILAHPEFVTIAEAIHAMGATFSPSSVRADAIDDDRAALLSASRHRSIALGVEAGSQKLRASLGKGISDARIVEAAGTLASHGITAIRLYFMIGLPGETDEDIDAIDGMARRIYAEIAARAPRARRALGVSITATTFVPKPSTPFSDKAFAGEREIKAKVKRLRRAIAREKGIELRTDSYQTARIEHLIAHGGPGIISFFEAAHALGDPRRALTRADRNGPID